MQAEAKWSYIYNPEVDCFITNTMSKRDLFLLHQSNHFVFLAG